MSLIQAALTQYVTADCFSLLLLCNAGAPVPVRDRPP